MGSLIASQDYRDVMSRPELLPGPMSGFMALKQLLSMLMSLAPDDTKGQKVRGVSIGPLPSLAATIGRTGPAPHQLKHSGEGPTCYLGSTKELTLLRGAWSSRSQGLENGRTGHTCHLVRERCFPLPLVS